MSTRLISDSHDQPLFDEVAAEEAQLFGLEVHLWSVRRGKRDARFGEPTEGEDSFDGPYKVHGILDLDLSGATAENPNEEGGREIEIDGALKIPRILIEEAGAQPPKAGDVVAVLFEREQVRRYTLPRGAILHEWEGGAKLYLDVERSGAAGALNQPGEYSRYSMEVLYRAQFPPDQRLGDHS